MKTLLFFGEDFVIDADKIVALAPACDRRKTKVWAVGQSAVDGAFLCDIEYEEALMLWMGEEEDDATDSREIESDKAEELP